MTDTARRGRRQLLQSVLAVAGAASLAGCGRLWSQPGASDVIVANATDAPLSVEVTITPSGDEEPHTDRVLSADARETVDPVNRSKLPLTTDYEVEVDVADGPSETFTWRDPDVTRAHCGSVSTAPGTSTSTCRPGEPTGPPALGPWHAAHRSPWRATHTPRYMKGCSYR